MTVFILDTATKSLRAKLTANQATAAVHLTAHWADSTSDGTKVAEGSYPRYSSGTASIKLVAAPSGSPLPKRDIITLSAVNNDSVAQTVVFYIDDGGIENDIFTVPLVTGQSWNSSAGVAASSGGGTGDMLKSTYDPDNNGIIAIAQGGTDANTASGARSNLGLGVAAQYAVGLTTGTVAPGNTKLDDWAATDDNTDLNVSLAAHGLAPKGTTGTTQFWRQDWTLAAAGGGGSANLWNADSNTWTRTGNYTFTVSGDVSAILAKGTFLRWKDGGAYKYGVVLSSVFSSPNTTITMITNNDYLMAAATITDNYFSYGNPPDFPSRFAYTPTWASNVTQPSIGNGTLEGWFSVVGKMLTVSIHLIAGTTTNFGVGTYDWELPCTTSAQAVGSAQAVHFGGTWHAGCTFRFTDGTVAVVSENYGLNWANNTPATWGSTDFFWIAQTAWL